MGAPAKENDENGETLSRNLGDLGSFWGLEEILRAPNFSLAQASPRPLTTPGRGTASNSEALGGLI